MNASSGEGLSATLEDGYEAFRRQGFAGFPSRLVRGALAAQALEHLPLVLDSFARLVRDPHMGDGGTYRYRRYARFAVANAEQGLDRSLTLLEERSIFQTVEDNPVNGGVVRTFAPLAPEIAHGPFLQALIAWDLQRALACDPELESRRLVVGVHQVRIVAQGGEEGLPTPEGVHRDAERFTFQHFMARQHISGGEFRAYDQERRFAFGWQQEECLDTVMFEGDTWHSATPIRWTGEGDQGHRDILLIDFDPI